MDAKITKQRLSNLLSYDWLKILVTIVIAVVGLILIFTMTATNPTVAQTFAIYAYTDMRAGSESYALADKLEEKNVFSYDILKVNTESFHGNSYTGAAYSARRAAGEGTVMFLSSFDKEGNPTKESELYRNTYESVFSGGAGGGFYNPQYFLETEIKEYLASFFGASLTGEIDEQAARERFLERNGKDNRFRFSNEKKEAGVLQEKARLEKLRDDYLSLQQAFADGKLRYTAVHGESGETQTFGWGETCPEGYYAASVDMSALREITKLYCFEYTQKAENEGESDKTVTTEKGVNLTVFRNSRKYDYDLCYETVSFLNYLAQNYFVS